MTTKQWSRKMRSQHDLQNGIRRTKTTPYGNHTLPQEVEHEALRSTGVAGPRGIEAFPASKRDPPGAGDLVAQLQAAHNPVTILRLIRHVEGGDPGDDFRRQQTADNLDGREIETGCAA